MASIYKNNNTWYLSVNIGNKRKSKSLRTDDYKVARALKPHIEAQLIAELTGISKTNERLTFPELADRFLKAEHGWAQSTYELKRHIYSKHSAGYPLPTNPNTRAIHIAHINACWNWGFANNLVEKANTINGDTKGEFRARTYSEDELKIMFAEINDESFNSFVRFAYYTGARSGEIRRLSRENVLDESLIVKGKTGRRIVKLNGQAQEIIKNQDPLWSYRKDFVSHKFKKEVRRLGIKDARFHDLRRTFGLNLIKQGMSIYKVSKLLGHSSVRTTEQHYAPLLTVEIEDFVL